MKLKLQLFIACAFSIVSMSLTAQNSTEDLEKRTEALEKTVKALSKLKVSGYIQTQFQAGQKDASLKVGNNDNKQSGINAFNRVGIRRGRIKFTYEEGIASGVFQLDITEKGVAFKDVYLNVKDPWIKTNQLRAGIFDRPFGYEIGYSSSRRESPERSAIFQDLFPDERDLGAMLILQPAKESPLHALKFQGGVFAGNGIKQDNDRRKDFIGQIRLDNNVSTIGTYGVGVSTYLGSVYQGTENVYKMDGNSFKLNESEDNIGKYAKRQYVGFDGQMNLKSDAGLTKISAEYLLGQQPALKDSHKSPNDSKLTIADTYIRNFSGGYVMLVQEIGRSPFAAVLKYDWYDPNTKVSGNEVGRDSSGTSKTDRSQNTFGFGALWNAHKSVRITAYYEFNNYEKSDHLSDPHGNVFTFRLQYKF